MRQNEFVMLYNTKLIECIINYFVNLMYIGLVSERSKSLLKEVNFRLPEINLFSWEFILTLSNCFFNWFHFAK